MEVPRKLKHHRTDIDDSQFVIVGDSTVAAHHRRTQVQSNLGF